MLFGSQLASVSQTSTLAYVHYVPCIYVLREKQLYQNGMEVIVQVQMRTSQTGKISL